MFLQETKESPLFRLSDVWKPTISVHEMLRAFGGGCILLIMEVIHAQG